MIYLDYENMWNNIKVLEKKCMELINARDFLYDYVDSDEKIEQERKKYDNKIKNINKTLDERYILLNRKRSELKQSKNIYDVVYVYRYIERMSVHNISIRANYSRQQIYRFLKIIEGNIKKAR
jgi:hypothetical protein